MNEPAASELATAGQARLPRWLVLALCAALALRLSYHAAYLMFDPFARVALADGQVYEDAARDLLAHPPLGSQPFYLQGLYSAFLALGLWARGQLIDALILQLAAAGCGLWLFARAASLSFGRRAGALSLLVLCSSAALTFYENKYLSAQLGVLTNICALYAFARASAASTPSGRVFGAAFGVASGLAILGRPNMLFALPFSALALQRIARARGQPAVRLLSAYALGTALALTPMLLRNAIVIGQPQVFASHGGGIPFYIGNGPRANGLWNDAGGLLSGQVGRERKELAAKLGVREGNAALDAALGRELFARALAHMRSQPLEWLRLEAKKLWYTLGNAELVHDYDWLGERELLAWLSARGVPFGLLLGLGALGLYRLARPRAGESHPACLERCARGWFLWGQIVAVLLANVVWFTAAQHRMPLVIPLAFASGPFLEGVIAARTWRVVPTWVAVAALALALQAFWPRPAPTRPSSAHYYNLAVAFEQLGRYPEALNEYAHAVARNPRQAMFYLRLARLAVATRRDAEARAALAGLRTLSGVDPDILRAADTQQRLLDQRER